MTTNIIYITPRCQFHRINWKPIKTNRWSKSATSWFWKWNLPEIEARFSYSCAEIFYEGRTENTFNKLILLQLLPKTNQRLRLDMRHIMCHYVVVKMYFSGTRFVHFMHFVLHSLRNRPRTTKSFEFIEQGQAAGRFAFVQEPDWIIFDSRIDELE